MTRADVFYMRAMIRGKRYVQPQGALNPVQGRVASPETELLPREQACTLYPLRFSSPC